MAIPGLNIQPHFDLKPFNTFGVACFADFGAELEQPNQLQLCIAADGLKPYPKVLILGGGSNILFTQPFEGLVLKNNTKGIEKIRETDSYVWLKVASGEVWHEVVEYALQNNWAGLENLSLIPGTVGAAPIQNIGAYGVELESVFDSLTAIELETGAIRIFSASDCAFGYRNSVFKQHLKDKFFISEVVLKLSKQPTLQIQYGIIQETLLQMGITKPSIQQLSAAVVQIRQSKLPNPTEIGNCGSFFKNPEISVNQFEALISEFPLVPSYPAAKGKVKIPAGWLIEHAGLKGYREGQTGIHHAQALVIVNHGQATGADIWTFAQWVQQQVSNKFGIKLSAEVNVR